MSNHDLDPRIPLELLDPGASDPGYWSRFRGRVVMDAAPELARRRRFAEVTISDLVLSWSRLLVPATVATAAAAALLLFFTPEEPASALMDVEELLLWETVEGDGEALPAVFPLGDDEAEFELFLVAVEGLQ